MRSLGTLLRAASAAAATVVVAAAAHSLASWSVFFATPVGEMLRTLGLDALLTPFTAWATSATLVVLVLSWCAATRSPDRWWRPSAVGTGLLAAWTAAAWVDGARTTRALLDGQPSQTWVEWPGETTPLHGADPLAMTSWSLDALSATGPAIVLVALWAGPLLLRSSGAGRAGTGATEVPGSSGAGLAGTSSTAVPGAHPWACSASPGAPSADAAAGPADLEVVGREVSRSVSVASGAGVLLCLGVVLLQTAGGIFWASESLDGDGWLILLQPGFVVIATATAAAWRVRAAPTRDLSGVPCWRAAVPLLLTAVATTALLGPVEPDLVMLVAAGTGVLVAAARTAVARWLTALLLPGRPVHAGTGTPSSAALLDASVDGGCQCCNASTGARRDARSAG